MKKNVYRVLKLIDLLHWTWLVLAAPFFLFPSPSRSIALLVVPGIWLLRLVIVRWEKKIEDQKLKIEKKAFPITPLNLSLLVLVLMVLVSTWATYSIEQSLEKISGVVLGLGVFYALERVGKNFVKWGISLTGFLAGGLAWAILGFLALNYQVRFSFLAPIIERVPNIILGLPGAESGLQHNAVGGTILWYLPVFIVLSIYFLFSKVDRLKQNMVEGLKLKVESFNQDNSRNNFTKTLFGFASRKTVIWLLKVVLWLATLFIFWVLVLTQSRGSYLAFAAAVLGMLFFVLRRKGRWMLSGLSALGLIGIAAWIFKTGGWEAWTKQMGLAAQEGYSIDTLGARLEIWSRAIYGIQDFAITGMGMNTFREVVHVLYPLFTISPDFDIAHAHNKFLQAGLDLGLPGLIAFLSIYLLSGWMLIKVWKDSPDQEQVEQRERRGWFRSLNLQQTFALGMGGGLFGHMIFGMADAITLGAKPGIFYWYHLGLITSLYMLRNKLSVEE